MTVDKLKYTIKKFNEAFNQNLKLSGLKNDLLQRLRFELDRLTNDPDSLRRARAIIDAVKTNYAPSPPNHHSYGNYGAPAAAPAYRPPPPAAPANIYQSGYGAAAASYHQALPVPRYPVPGAGAHASGSGAPAPGAWNNPNASGIKDEVPVRFRSSPFFRIEQSLCQVTPLQRAGPGDRKSQMLQFALTDPQRALLLASKTSTGNPQYQVRLFCTSEDYFNPARSSAIQQPAPIDFPGTCEIKLNSHPVTANTKGIKKQPGTAPPADLSKGSGLNLAQAVLNRIEIVYVNTEKRYFLVVCLIEVTSVQQVVAKIKAAKFRSKEEVVQSIILQNSDPDVVATAQGLTLKDPLTFSRIKIPIRSVHCFHIGCFDAETFFMMNEQTPVWKCPICSMVLRVEDIRVDGYFDDILKTCPSSIDAATVEPDGTWRSSDDKHGTGKRKSMVPANSMDLDKGKGRAYDHGSILIDSEDDDDDEVDSKPLVDRIGGFKRAKHNMISLDSSPSPSSQGGSSSVTGAAARKSRSTEIIDLTLSSDDDEPPPRPPPGPPIRIPPPPPARVLSNGNGSGSPAMANGSGFGSSSQEALMRAHEETRRLNLGQVDRREHLERAQADAIRRQRDLDALAAASKRQRIDDDDDDARNW